MNRIFKKTLEFLLVLLINLFFLWIVRQLPMTSTTTAESLASIIAATVPEATYVRQVDTARSLLKLYKEGSIPFTQQAILSPAGESARRAAEEALRLEGFSNP